MVKIPIFWPLPMSGPQQLYLGIPRGNLLSFVLRNKPSQWLFGVCHFLALCSCGFEWGLLLSRACESPTMFLILPRAPPLLDSTASRRQEGRGAYHLWNPQNTESTLIPCVWYGKRLFSLSCCILSHYGEEVSLGRNLSYKRPNTESTGRPTLRLSQTGVNQPKPTVTLAQSWAGTSTMMMFRFSPLYKILDLCLL